MTAAEQPLATQAAPEETLPRDQDPEWQELADLAVRIKEADAALKAMWARRKELYHLQLARGRPRAHIAQQAGVSDMAVAFVVDPNAKNKKPPKATKRARKAAPRPAPQ